MTRVSPQLDFWVSSSRVFVYLASLSLRRSAFQPTLDDLTAYLLSYHFAHFALCQVAASSFDGEHVNADSLLVAGDLIEMKDGPLFARTRRLLAETAARYCGVIGHPNPSLVGCASFRLLPIEKSQQLVLKVWPSATCKHHSIGFSNGAQ